MELLSAWTPRDDRDERWGTGRRGRRGRRQAQARVARSAQPRTTCGGASRAARWAANPPGGWTFRSPHHDRRDREGWPSGDGNDGPGSRDGRRRVRGIQLSRVARRPDASTRCRAPLWGALRTDRSGGSICRVAEMVHRGTGRATPIGANVADGRPGSQPFRNVVASPEHDCGSRLLRALGHASRAAGRSP